MSIATASLIITLLALTIAAGVSWGIASCIRRRPLRVSVRIAALLLLAFPARASMQSNVSERMDEGEYVCTTCGHRIDRITCSWFDAPIWTGSSKVERAANSSPDAYAQLVAGALGPSHEHRWMAIGCHAMGNDGVSCCVVGAAFWFDEIPALPDHELSRGLARRFGMATWDEQYAVLDESDSALYGDRDRHAAFRAWLADWRKDHPDWP